MAEKKAKLLVVEDETFLRELYEELLIGDGYDVTVAADGEQALRAIEESVFDLTMLDIMLPKKDGLQIMEELKEVEKLNRMGKIVLLTNLGQDAVIKRGFALGAIGYLIKSSYTPNQVSEEVANFLKREESAPEQASTRGIV